ncbi:MAG: MFS transporter [Gaiellales bacterium]
MPRQPRPGLVALVCAIEFVDLSLLSAISPLLPVYAERFGFETAESGLIVAAFGVGNLVAALPAAILCGKLGAKPVAIAGLALTAAGCVWLGFADSTFELVGARFVQGAASAIAWGAGLAWLVGETPSGRRGRILGITGACAVIGMLAGPALGALAAELGIARVFVAYSAAAATLAFLALFQPGTAASGQSWRVLLTAVRRPELIFGFWIIFLAGAFLAAQGAIGPLRLDALGWSATGIGAVYMVSAALEATGNPFLGHWLDRAGQARPTGVILAIATVAAAALAVPSLERYWPYAILIALSSAAFGFCFLPGLMSLSRGAEAADLDYAYGVSLASVSWGPGQVVGSLVAGTVAVAAGDAAAFGLLAAITFATLLVLPRLLPSTGSASTVSAGRPGR